MAIAHAPEMSAASADLPPDALKRMTPVLGIELNTMAATVGSGQGSGIPWVRTQAIDGRFPTRQAWTPQHQIPPAATSLQQRTPRSWVSR